MTNSESDAKTSSSPKKKTGNSSPLSGSSSNHTVRKYFWRSRVHPERKTLHFLLLSLLHLGVTSSLRLDRQECWFRQRQQTAVAAESDLAFPLATQALPLPLDLPTLSRLVELSFARFSHHPSPLEGWLPADLLRVELLVSNHPSRGFGGRRSAPGWRPRFCRRQRFPAPAASFSADAGTPAPLPPPRLYNFLSQLFLSKTQTLSLDL